MTLRFLYLFSIAALLFSCSDPNLLKISGVIKDAPDDEKAYLEEVRTTKVAVIDSCRLSGSGKVRFKLELDRPGIYQLSMNEGKTFSLIVSPGEKIRFSTNYEDFHGSMIIEGSENTERVKTLHDSLRLAIIQLQDIQTRFTEQYDTLSDNDELITRLTAESRAIRKSHHDYTVKFILEDINALANIAALYQEYSPNDFVLSSARDLQYFKLVSDSLQKYYPKVRQVQALKSTYTNLLANYNRQRIMGTTEVITYEVPDLNLPNQLGTNSSLSSLKSNYVLLSFWAVNQEESIQNTINLKKVYSKFKDREFEIYQVAAGASYEEFLARIRFEEIPWVSVCDTAFPYSTTRGLYNVNALPMNYLLNQDQTEILAKNVDPEKLEQTLHYLLNRNPECE